MKERIKELKNELSRKGSDEDYQTAPQPVAKSTPYFREG